MTSRHTVPLQAAFLKDHGRSTALLKCIPGWRPSGRKSGMPTDETLLKASIHRHLRLGENGDNDQTQPEETAKASETDEYMDIDGRKRYPGCSTCKYR